MRSYLKFFIIFIYLQNNQAFSAESCGKISILDMNWNSATLISNIDKYILEKGYGCDVELMASEAYPSVESIVELNEPDVIPEMWLGGVEEAIRHQVNEKRLRLAGDPLIDGAQEGFWVPKYLVELNPSLANIEGILEQSSLFIDSEKNTTPVFHTCPDGWVCQIQANNIFSALGMDTAGFKIHVPKTSEELSNSIAKAYDNGQGWLGYYWSPTAVLGRYEMVKIDFGTGVDESHFNNCLSQEVCENPRPSMWPPASVKTVTTERFASNETRAFTYFTKRNFTNNDMNTLLAWMEYNESDGTKSAIYFLKNYEKLWGSWVSPDAADKIKASLK